MHSRCVSDCLESGILGRDRSHAATVGHCLQVLGCSAVQCLAVAQTKLACIGVKLIYFWGGPRPPMISNFSIKPMVLHDKNGIRIHKFTIMDPQSFSEIDTVARVLVAVTILF